MNEQRDGVKKSGMSEHAKKETVYKARVLERELRLELLFFSQICGSPERRKMLSSMVEGLGGKYFGLMGRVSTGSTLPSERSKSLGLDKIAAR
jgi:hypothetical protein